MLTPQSDIQPNAVLVPNLVFSTRVVNGQLRTTAVITLASAKVELVDGTPTWTQVGAPVNIVVPDVSSLPTDLATLQNDANAAMASMISLVGAINAVRKAV